MEKPQKTTRRTRGAIAGLNETARGLRHHLTPAESHLWQALRNRQLNGLKFRRQHPVGRFVLDFFCAEHQLVIELDGGIHDAQIEHDAERSRRLGEFGYRVLRFSNEEVFENLAGVLERIAALTLTPIPLTPNLNDSGEGITGNLLPKRKAKDSPLPSLRAPYWAVGPGVRVEKLGGDNR